MPEDFDVADGGEIGEDEIRARSFWSGTLTFGLVSIPVSLYPANRPQRVSLRMLAPSGTPLKREYFDPRTHRRVSNDSLIRGFELDEGAYVTVTEEELESVEPEKSRDIDLRLFVPRGQLDPLFFDRAYYLTPAGESTKAYKLLAETMEQTGRAGIATFVMRDKEYLIAILAEEGIMRAETLRFADEIRSPDDVGLPERVRIKTAERKKMEAAMKKLAEKEFNAKVLVDRTTERLLDLIEEKRASGEDVIEAEDGEEPPDDIIDLMEVLKRSLSGDRSADASHTSHTSGARKGTHKSARKSTAKASKKSAPRKAAAKKTAKSASKATAKKHTRKKAS